MLGGEVVQREIKCSCRMQETLHLCLQKGGFIDLLVGRASDFDAETACPSCMAPLKDCTSPSLFPNRPDFTVVTFKTCSKPHPLCLHCFCDWIKQTYMNDKGDMVRRQVRCVTCKSGSYQAVDLFSLPQHLQ
mmetsp:Transcript_16853/g.33220  ORF Transcript_16853/g.33220 Transcript_16853/m.33220 type:complete len:132 (-) Transcript_16853:148-543(-)